MKKLITYSLWGDNPKYTIGAIRNAEQIKKVYPGWIGRFYCANSVPDKIKSKLKDLGSEVIEINTPGNRISTLWRFLPIAEKDVEVMLSRDTDSRLSEREMHAVNHWLSTDKLFHVMRDHPEHNAIIMAGMWGAKKPILQDMDYLLKSYKMENTFQIDQNFLRDVVWPRVAYTACVHDPFFAKIPFPSQRAGYEFVGQVWDENEVTVPEHIARLKEVIG